MSLADDIRQEAKISVNPVDQSMPLMPTSSGLLDELRQDDVVVAQ